MRQFQSVWGKRMPTAAAVSVHGWRQEAAMLKLGESVGKAVQPLVIC
jgi:hypothetical protein